MLFRDLIKGVAPIKTWFQRLLVNTHRPFQLVLLILGSMMLVVACQSSPGSQDSSQISECRQFEHAMGVACLPPEPERVVTLDKFGLETALALGFEPVGAPGRYFSYLKEISSSSSQQGNLEKIQDIGWPPNLEKIVALDPDMILGINTSVLSQNYEEASQIAPTVLLPFSNSGNWKKHFRQAGKALGKGKQLKGAIEEYQARLDSFQEQMGERLQEIEVSLIRIYPDRISIYTKGGFPGTVLEDAGLSRPPSQNLSAEETKEKYGNTVQYFISKELLHRADGDVMFVTGSQEQQQTLQDLKAEPLWSKLNAVKQGKVYEVGGYWIGSSYLAANQVIDDLFKRLFIK